MTRLHPSPANTSKRITHAHRTLSQVCLITTLLLAACGSSSAAPTHQQAAEVWLGAYRDTIATGGFTFAGTAADSQLTPAHLTGVVSTAPLAERLTLPSHDHSPRVELLIGETDYVPASPTSSGTWLVSTTSGNVLVDVGDLLAMAKDHAQGPILQVGHATIDHIPTTAYRTTFTAQALQTLNLAALGSGVVATIHPRAVALTLWIAGQRRPLIKRIGLSWPAKNRSHQVPLATFDLYHFATPAPIAPLPIGSVSVNADAQTVEGTVPIVSPPPANPVIVNAQSLRLNDPIIDLVDINDGDIAVVENTPQGATIARLNPTTHTITATAALGRFYPSAITYANGELWLLTSPANEPIGAAATVQALNPDTMSLLFERELSGPPSGIGSNSSIAIAKGNLWLATNTDILGFTSWLHPIAKLPLLKGAQQAIEFAASANGRQLYSTATSDGGSLVKLAQRSPSTGRVVATLPNHDLVGVGGTEIVPMGNTAWVAEATGLEGNFGRVQLNATTHSPTRVLQSPDDGVFTNGLRLASIDHLLYAYEDNNQQLDCLNPATGSLRARTETLPAIAAMVAVGQRQLAMGFDNGELTIGQASPACVGA